MTSTPDNKPGPHEGTDRKPESQTSEDEAEAMEEAQKEGAEQRKEGGYQ